MEREQELEREREQELEQEREQELEQEREREQEQERERELERELEREQELEQERMKRFTDDAVRSLLATEVGKAGGVRRWAILKQVPASLVSDSRTGRRALGPSILAALGLEKHVHITHYYTPVRPTPAKRG